MSRRKIGYAYSKAYTSICDLLPSNIGRASLVDGLISAYESQSQCDQIIPPSFASKAQLVSFHDSDFISFLLGEEVELDEDDSDDNDSSRSDFEQQPDHDDRDRKLQARFGVEFDCPRFQGLDKYIQAVAGTTLSCARFLSQETAGAEQKIAVNWHGGRHHAGKERCSGFCYVNDIVLGILELRKQFDKVMYIDLDLHHGDGVEKAFAHSNKVLNLSIHRFDRGFFPGTGNTKHNGKGKGEGYTINVGLRAGLSDASHRRVVEEVVLPAYQKFKPDVVVLQCGADGLARDPAKEWNLTTRGLGDLILDIIGWGSQPCLLLGGGGYNHPDAARVWCYVLACLTVGRQRVEKWDLIPENAESIDEFADDGFAFYVENEKRSVPDRNLQDAYLERIIEYSLSRLGLIAEDV